MSFEFTPEHQAVREMVRRSPRPRSPRTPRWDVEHHFPIDVVRQMGEPRPVRAGVPRGVGGGNGDFVSLCIAIEEIGRVDQSLGITLSAGVGLGANPIFRSATTTSGRWLPDLVAGRALRCLRPHRARCRQRRRCHWHPPVATATSG